MRTCLLILLAATAVAQDKPVVVEGTVVDSKTKVPLGNVAVAVRYTKPPDGGRIMTAQNAQGAVTLTGPDGRFRLEESKTVPFRLYLELEGYVKQTASRVFELKPGESATAAALELDPESQVVGRVFDEETAQPVGGLTVLLVRTGGLAASSATTDAGGHYAIRSIAPGDYRLAVSASDRPRAKPAPKTAVAASLAYPYTWFPGVTEASGAMTIQVPSGAQLSGYDFHVCKRAVLAVRGTVELDGTAGPISMTLVESTDRGTAYLTLGTLPQPGPFEVTGVPPGSYILGAFNPTSKRGEFVLEGVSMEPWRVSLRDLPPGFIVRQVLYNGAEVDPGFFEPNPGVVSHHLAVLVGKAENSLQGMVKRGDKPVDQAIVMGIREGHIDPRRRPEFLYGKTDAPGHYSVAPVAPGTYRVLAVSGPEQTFGVKQRFLNGEGAKVEIGLTTQAVADLELK